MPVQATIKRYLLIYQKLKSAHYPSFQAIMSYLNEEGFELNERTINRDIKQMRDEFGIDICYDQPHNGYIINETSIPHSEDFIRLLGIMTTAGMLADTLKDGKNALRYLSFESNAQMEGIQFLDKLLSAIREQHIINFDHQNFHSGKTTHVVLKPYLLKEYMKRWYIIGLGSRRTTFTIYGIDRISALEITTERFQRENRKDPAKLFESIIGLNYNEHEEQQVVLSFAPKQGKYIKTLPIHSSQQIIVDNDTELRINLYLRPNYELNQLLLSYGDQVTILEPEWLKEQIIAIYKRALSNY